MCRNAYQVPERWIRERRREKVRTDHQEIIHDESHKPDVVADGQVHLHVVDYGRLAEDGFRNHFSLPSKGRWRGAACDTAFLGGSVQMRFPVSERTQHLPTLGALLEADNVSTLREDV